MHSDDNFLNYSGQCYMSQFNPVSVYTELEGKNWKRDLPGLACLLPVPTAVGWTSLL